MPRIVRGGLIQAKNVLGPEAGLPAIKKAMVDKHVKLIAEAAKKKVQLLCLQEIFYGPYFCAEQETRWYHLTEHVPEGPTVTLMRKLAKKHHPDQNPDDPKAKERFAAANQAYEILGDEKKKVAFDHGEIDVAAALRCRADLAEADAIDDRRAGLRRRRRGLRGRCRG